MEKLTKKLVVAFLILASIVLIPKSIFAKTSKEVQVVKKDNGDYVVYVKDLVSKSFSFAISDDEGKDPASTDLNYINSVLDGEGNQVALIEANTVSGKTETNLYIADTETKIDLNDAIITSDLELVEKTTARVKTELKTDIEERNEVIDGVSYIETVGGLEIVDDDKADSKYEYVSAKLPSDKYSDLQELAEQLNDGTYEKKDMFSKIKFAKEFISLYNELIDSASFKEVDGLVIKQPNDAKKDDKYVVLIKKTAKDGSNIYDAKFMTSYREDKEEKIPEQTITKVTQETTKLAITGENAIFYILPAILIIALAIVLIRMKQLKNKENNKNQ